MNSTIIECVSLCKEFKGKNELIRAVDNVNLQIRKSEIFLIKGRSGAGKSTLISLLSGLDRPTRGSVSIDNQKLGNLDDKAISKLLSQKIGIVFQNFNLLPTYTIYENIEIALECRNGNSLDHSYFKKLLKQLGLTEKENSFPTELSIGQQQKAAIARTLAKNPSIIFADEPTGSVDDEAADEIISHLLSLNKVENVTLVITSHGSKYDKYADTIVTMKDGKITN